MNNARWIALLHLHNARSKMDESKSSQDVENKLKTQLLGEEISQCVCNRESEKIFMSGWCPNAAQKEHKKRCEASKSCGNHASLRREKTVLATTGGFLFRHYESLDRYMSQYRQNHSTTCMDRDLDLQPVLGIDVPDPYLPKITSSSALMERLKIIEALSTYYKCATNPSRADIKNIWLAGKKADSIDLKSQSRTPNKGSPSALPSITNKASNNQELVQCLPTVTETQESICRDLPECPLDNVNRNKTNHTTNGQTDFRVKKAMLVLPAASLVCNDSLERRRRENIPTNLTQIPLWTECEPIKRQQTERVLDTLRIGRKLKPIGKELPGKLSEDVHDEENLNLCSNLDTREGMPSSIGNLCIGTTVSRNAKAEQPRKANKNRTPQSKIDMHSNSSYPSEMFHRKTTAPMETTFIKILGQQTVPKGADAKPDPKSVPSRIPLRLLRKFGRQSFHHVLVAHSCKAEKRKLRKTVIPN